MIQQERPLSLISIISQLMIQYCKIIMYSLCVACVYQVIRKYKQYECGYILSIFSCYVFHFFSLPKYLLLHDEKTPEVGRHVISLFSARIFQVVHLIELWCVY